MRPRFKVGRCCCGEVTPPAATLPIRVGRWRHFDTSTYQVKYPGQSVGTFPPTDWEYHNVLFGGTWWTSSIILIEQVMISNTDAVGSATLKIVTASAGTFGNGLAKINGYASDNAPPAGGPSPWAVGANVDAAPRTTANVPQFPFVRVNGPNVTFESWEFDVTSIVSEITTRPGWAIGNNLILFLISDGGTFDGGIGTGTLGAGVFETGNEPAQLQLPSLEYVLI